ncbi:hypothetical protein [Paenibacillus soyae]|uniref:Lipoprotein n=1 Tax=Paenibacillus soyae TaxID=2969249 RepID=A0A9X2MU35_9BACL|nr:hypothetical protein [Paenibacillus soyae]MCR2805801.1 hypothetical protein [Paenibacillus soyae]
MLATILKRCFILSLLLFIMAGCQNDNKTTDTEVSLYLVKDLSATEAMRAKLSDLPLEEMPILTHKDIERYDWQKHEFSLKAGISLEEKLEGKVPMSGKPFVVMADGVRIYAGSFWTYLSSQYNPDIPTITSIWQAGSEKSSYSIQYKKQPDSRADERIYGSLNKLGKMGEITKVGTVLASENQTKTVTQEQLKKITPQMTYAEAIIVLGESEDIGSGRYIMQYQVKDGEMFTLNYGSPDETISEEAFKQLQSLITK